MNPYTECALIPRAHLSATLTGSGLGGWLPLLSPWTPFLRWPAPLTPLAISLYVTVVISQVPHFTVARFS